MNKNIDPCEGCRRECEIPCWKVEHGLLVPVKLGRWIEGLDGSCMCSECGKVVRYDIENYCPRCGAQLEVED